MTTDQHEFDELSAAWLTGQASSAEALRLGEIVAADPVARDRLLVLADLHACLATDERFWAAPDSVRLADVGLESSRSVPARRRIPAALAFVVGLLFGFVPLVFGFTRAEPAASIAGPVPLVDGDFESDTAPGTAGLSERSGEWSGDFAAISTGAEQNMIPFRGRRMLQFLRSDFAGERFTRSATGEVLQIIDLRQWSRTSGPLAIELSGRVNASTAATDLDCRWVAHAFAFETDPSERRTEADYSWLYRECLAAAHRPAVPDDGDATTWQRISLDLLVPESANYLVISFGVQQIQPPPTTSPTRFPGHYLDAVEITPMRSPRPVAAAKR